MDIQLEYLMVLEQLLSACIISGRKQSLYNNIKTLCAYYGSEKRIL